MKITEPMWNAEVGKPVKGWEQTVMGHWRQKRKDNLTVKVYRLIIGSWAWEVSDSLFIYDNGCAYCAWRAMQAAKKAAKTVEV